jgi:hypothetical protein
MTLFCDAYNISFNLKTKYTDMVHEAQKKRLQSMRVDVKDMVHAKLEVKPEITLTGSAELTVGDWVDIEHDFSPGMNSGGGVAIITEIVGSLSHVKYILDGHTEKLIPIKRLTCISTPFRREMAPLRTRSVAQEQPDQGSLVTSRTMVVISVVSYISSFALHPRWLGSI